VRACVCVRACPRVRVVCALVRRCKGLATGTGIDHRVQCAARLAPSWWAVVTSRCGGGCAHPNPEWREVLCVADERARTYVACYIDRMVDSVCGHRAASGLEVTTYLTQSSLHTIPHVVAKGTRCSLACVSTRRAATKGAVAALMSISQYTRLLTCRMDRGCCAPPSPSLPLSGHPMQRLGDQRCVCRSTSTLSLRRPPACTHAHAQVWLPH
jgi:hypothetical protein